MSILKRVKNLMRADIHGLLDCVEEPRVVLKDAIREMEEIIGSENKKIQSIQIEIEKIDRQIIELISREESLESKLDHCLENKQESLCKKFIRDLLELRKSKELFNKKHSDKEHQLKCLKQEIFLKKEQLEDIRNKNQWFEELELGFFGCSKSVSSEDVELAYFQLRKSRESQGEA